MEVVRNTIEMALENAAHMLHTKGTLASAIDIPYSINTNCARTVLTSNRTTTIWNTLESGCMISYTQTIYCLASSLSLYADVFRAAFDITGRFNMDSFLRCTVSKWTMTTSIVYESFVLSKTAENMTWHVDGGTLNKSDLVVYIVMGPQDAISCFMLLAIDHHALVSAQCNNPKFASADELNMSLGQLDGISLAMNAPDINGCTATLQGLCNFRELNGLKVTVGEYIKDNHYRITLHSTGKDKKVHVKHLVLAPQYCPLPIEIREIAINLHPILSEAIEMNVLRCYCVWGRTGQVVIFDGSKVHGVYNFESHSGIPQIALAVNYRGVVPHIMNTRNCKRVKLTYK